jgi:hypothetical protein
LAFDITNRALDDSLGAWDIDVDGRTFNFNDPLRAFHDSLGAWDFDGRTSKFNNSLNFALRTGNLNFNYSVKYASTSWDINVDGSTRTLKFA